MKKRFCAVFFAVFLIISSTACTNPWAPEEEPDHTPSYTIGNWDNVGSTDDASLASPEEEKEPLFTEEQYNLFDPAPGTGYVRSDLTNEWITSEAAKYRPLAVMVPNNVNSLPHYNLSKAGVLYECNVEYEITRLVPIFDDWTGLERIGNIRSARDYLVIAAMEWDPLILHIGQIWYADEILEREEVHNINGLTYDKAYYRVSTERRDYDQSAYSNGYSVKNAATALKYPLEHTSIYKPGHFSFAPKGLPTTLTDVYGNLSATYVSLEKAYPIDQPYFIYNEETGLYDRYEYGIPHTDGATGEQLSFANIIIQSTYREYRPDGAYLIYRMHDTTSDGYFITRGRAVHITWKKEGTYGITRYYDDNGDEIVLNQGKTMICIIEKGDGIVMQ